MTDYKRPKLHLPLALLARKMAAKPTDTLPRRAPCELRRLVAAMID